eukprot:475458-Heterocapsa_arctica.AAC.1
MATGDDGKRLGTTPRTSEQEEKDRWRPQGACAPTPRRRGQDARPPRSLHRRGARRRERGKAEERRSRGGAEEPSGRHRGE